MKALIRIGAILFFTISVMNISLFAQDETNGEKNGYEFTIVKELPATPVKNQFRSGTCWSFSTISFIESELLRMGKGEYDLSEMFSVRHDYEEKATKYVRFHGNLTFGSGGEFHDVMHVIKKYGMVPEEVYSGKVIGEKNHIHGELDAVTAAYVKAIVTNPNRKLTPVWHDGFDNVLDAYLGKLPSTFEYKGKQYDPKSFAEELGINPDDYVEITSYTHHPFYDKFIIEIPDNWMFDETYNVPLDDLMQIIDYSIAKGYTIAWGADVSDKGFSWKNGVAIVPDEERPDLTGTEKERWEKLTEKEKKEAIYSFDGPEEEKNVTQEMRQKAFDDYSTTDDHGMHIIGVANDQDGNKYYKVKNSWGSEGQIYDGYFYASVPYVRLRTIDIMVNKASIPSAIRKKLGL